MAEITQAEVLERQIPELEAEGYEVYLNPARTLVPDFLGDFRPDAIAVRKDKRLIIEVLRRSKEASKQLEHVSKLLDGRKDWELRVYWIAPASDIPSLDVQPREHLAERLSEVRKLASGGHAEPALLLAWATFEAVARRILPDRFERPQTPGRVVDVLATAGEVTPTEADQLRQLANKRNRVVHGDFQSDVIASEIEQFVSIIDRLLTTAVPA